MFDVMLRELATRFGLGERARDLLGALLALIFDAGHGGFEGFVARLRAAGLGAVVDSWLGRGENKLITSAGVTSAFGTELLDLLASRAGMTRERTASALTALLPGVLDKLTPDAVRPPAGSVPAAAAPYLAGHEAFAGQARGLWPQAQLQQTVELALPAPGPAAVQVQNPAAADGAREAPDDSQHGPSQDGGMGGRWIFWVTLLVLAVGAALWLGHPGSPNLPVPAPTRDEPLDLGAPQPASQAVARASEPTLRIAWLNGRFRIEGTLGSAAEREQLLAVARDAGQGSLDGEVAVDAALPAAPWSAALVDTLPQLAVEGLEMELVGPVVDLKSVPPGSDPAGLDLLAQRFPGQWLTGWFDPAARALAGLTGSTVDTAALTAALNTMTLHFTSGSHALRADSRRLLKRAAAALKRAPAETMIEIGGHTDDQGQPQDNQSLSEARAFAVMEALIEDGVPHARLTARGYGASQPLADNRDAEGRARNRRIGFIVLR